ncbi:hypothetical protein LCGC14_1319850 [marine sediment metagenome]|uniref:Uncharacterized protein n=1 Tax=marine sediment metagenome TaxID=412755 RepID=A0A0F9KKF4_9ZZZZ
MKLTAQEPKRINDGVHEGVITSVEYRAPPVNKYCYTDLVIEFNQGEDKHKLKYGVPTTVMLGSKLAKLMTLFGEVIETGKDYDPDEIFIGKKCSFQTMMDGHFANIVKDSVKPLE